MTDGGKCFYIEERRGRGGERGCPSERKFGYSQITKKQPTVVFEVCALERCASEIGVRL